MASAPWINILGAYLTSRRRVEYSARRLSGWMPEARTAVDALDGFADPLLISCHRGPLDFFERRLAAIMSADVVGYHAKTDQRAGGTNLAMVASSV